MSESEKESPKNIKNTSSEQEESEDLSRSPGVTDRELLSREKSSQSEEMKQSAQQSQTETSQTED